MSHSPPRFSRRSALAGASLTGAGLFAAPLRAHAQQGHAKGEASPTADDSGSSGEQSALQTLLAYVPQSRLEGALGIPYWTFSDHHRQLTSLGLHHDSGGPDYDNEPALAATAALAQSTSIGPYAGTEELAAALGFLPAGMNQSMGFGDLPGDITMYRGEFDASAVIAAWEGADYEPVDTDSGIAAWTIGPDGEIDMLHPVQRYGLSALNNIAIVDDVVISASRLATLNEVLDHIASGGPSVLDDEIHGPVIRSLPPTIVSGMGFAPITGLDHRTIDDDVAATLEQDHGDLFDAAGPMPTMTSLALGVNEGAVPLDFEWQGQTVENAGTVFLRMGMESSEDAEQALTVLEARIATMRSWMTPRPFADLLSIDDVSVEGTIAQATLTQLELPNYWTTLVLYQDALLFLPESARS